MCKSVRAAVVTASPYGDSLDATVIIWKHIHALSFIYSTLPYVFFSLGKSPKIINMVIQSRISAPRPPPPPLAEINIPLNSSNQYPYNSCPPPKYHPSVDRLSGYIWLPLPPFSNIAVFSPPHSENMLIRVINLSLLSLPERGWDCEASEGHRPGYHLLPAPHCGYCYEILPVFITTVLLLIILSNQ